MVVLPWDYLIKDGDEFIRVINDANEFVSEKQNTIITLGIKPSRSETVYGYIKFNEEKSNLNSHEVIKVEFFVEKTNKEIAEKYLSYGFYLWNGGMFVWSTRNILEKINKYPPDTYNDLADIEEIDERWIKYLIKAEYNEMEAIYIDYAVIGKSKDICIISTDVGWDDISLCK